MSKILFEVMPAWILQVAWPFFTIMVVWADMVAMTLALIWFLALAWSKVRGLDSPNHLSDAACRVLSALMVCLVVIETALVTMAADFYLGVWVGTIAGVCMMGMIVVAWYTFRAYCVSRGYTA